MPSQANEGDAGRDLYLIEDLVLYPGKPALAHTGISVAIPMGYEMQIRPRSGLALKKAVTVLNSPGTIESGDRGEVGVILIYHGEVFAVLNKGERIAQAVVAKYEMPNYNWVDDLDDSSERGEGGYGSSGE